MLNCQLIFSFVLSQNSNTRAILRFCKTVRLQQAETFGQLGAVIQLFQHQGSLGDPSLAFWT